MSSPCGSSELTAPRLRPVGSSMWSSAVSRSTRRKWWETRAVTAGNSSPNASTICCGGGGVVARRVADRLADVFIEQLDGTLGEPAHRLIGIAGQRQQVGERQTELQEAQRRPDEVDVGGGVALLAVDGSAQPDALALHGLDQRGRHAAAGRERVQIQEFGRGFAALGPSGGDGGREVRIGHAQLAADHAPDRRQRQPFALERPDLGDPLDVFGAVPGHASFAFGLREQPARLVVAHGVDRDVADRGQLFHAVPHDQTLYECSLTRSSGTACRGFRARAPGLRCARMKRVARPVVSLGVVLACVIGTMALGTALKSPCASGSWSDVRQYRFLCYSDIVPLLATEQLFERGGRPPLPRRMRGPRGPELRRVPGGHDVLHPRRGVALGRRLHPLLLRERPDAAGLCRAGRGVPLRDERLARALLRAGAHPGDLRHDELGPARRGLRHGGSPATSSEDARWPPAPRSGSAPRRSSIRGCWRSP